MAHCLYAIYHLSRKASGRTPGSSAAYHVFAAIADLAVMSLYAYGAFSTHKGAQYWTTRLSNPEVMRYLVPAVYYITIGVGGLHLISLSISLWLGMMFRRISLMPPDMNPLEDHLTARPFHKRNKSSITTGSSLQDEKRSSTPLSLQERAGPDSHRHARSPVVPFLHTRAGSGYSLDSRSSHIDLPSRQYQIAPGNSPRSSVYSSATKRSSMPRSSQLGEYSSIPALDGHALGQPTASHNESKVRLGKFTETWLPSDSLISRTKQRHYNKNTPAPTSHGGNSDAQTYAALVQAFNEDDSAESEYDDENEASYDRPRSLVLPRKHPNPLRSHPTSPPRNSHAVATKQGRERGNLSAEESASLSEVSGNMRNFSNSRDVTDRESMAKGPWKGQRDSSIQLDDGFFSKPYGQLKSATPPITIGSDRRVSSGVDYRFAHSYGAPGRRNVSGKAAEEGMHGFR